jgi:hypothetical protein
MGLGDFPIQLHEFERKHIHIFVCSEEHMQHKRMVEQQLQRL